MRRPRIFLCTVVTMNCRSMRRERLGIVIDGLPGPASIKAAWSSQPIRDGLSTEGMVPVPPYAK